LITEDSLDKVLEWLAKSAVPAAKARAERVYIEEYRKTLKALLMKKSAATSVNAQEVEAYAHPDYKMHLEALREAVEADEKFRWLMVTAEAKIRVWQSQNANARAMEKVT